MSLVRYGALGTMLALAACSATLSEVPVPTATPSTTATPQPMVDVGCKPNRSDACLGSLRAGKHSSTLFKDRFTFDVPAGWANHADSAGEYVLLPPGSHAAATEGGPRDWIAFEANVTFMPVGCPPPGTDVFDPQKRAADIANWMSTRAHLSTTHPHPVAVGGLDGMVIDVRLANDAEVECFDFPAVMLVHGLGPSDGYDQGVGAGTAMRFYFFDRGDDVLMIEIDDVSNGDHLDAFSAVLATVRFA
jgi:hypothetical protein